MMRSFEFALGKIIGLWYTMTPGWTIKISETLQQGQRYGDIFALYYMINLWVIYWNQFCFSKKLPYFSIIYHFESLVQDCSNSIANALDLLQSCTKPSISDELCFWNIKPWMSSYLISCNTYMHKEVWEESGVGTNSYWIIQPYDFPQFFWDRVIVQLI